MVTFLDEIKQQPEALRKLASELFDKAPEWVEHVKALIKEKKPNSVVFSGMGSSLFVGYIAGIYLREKGIHSVAVESYELDKHSRALIAPETLFVAVSQSGNSEELVDFVKTCGCEDRLIVVTNYETGELYNYGRAKVMLHAGKEETTATKSYTNTIAAVLALAVVIAGGEAGEWSKLHDGLLKCADIMQEFLDSRSGDIAKMSEMLLACRWAPLVGSGSSYCTCSHAELVLEEASKVYSSRFTLGQFIHGPIELIDENVCVILFDFDPDMRSKVDRVMSATTRYKGKVILLSNREAPPEYKGVLFINMDIDEPLFSPMAEIIPIELAVNSIGFSKGLTPGILTRVRK